MQYRRMGRSGLKLSEICLGTMTFGHGTDAAEAAWLVALALDSGVNVFDTANACNAGESETMLGHALKGRRNQAVVATKFFNPMGPGPNDSGMSRAHIFQALDGLAHRGERARPQPSPGGAALGARPAVDDQRHHRRPHCGPGRGFAPRRRLAAARGGAPAARCNFRLPWRYPRAMEAGMRARRDNAVKPPRLTPS